MSTEFFENYIGECISGSCDRPATVRVHKDFVLCALHNQRRVIGEEADAVGIGLDMLKGWRSEAEFHGAYSLVAVFGVAEHYLKERQELIVEMGEHAKQIDRENVSNHAFRTQG